MKLTAISLTVVILPIVLIIGLNEWMSRQLNEKGFQRNNIIAINPVYRTPEKCTWVCHNDTRYCKSQHTTLPAKVVAFIDPFYFGIIENLHSTGNYALANVAFLVVLIPALIYFLLIQCIWIEIQISKLKKG